MRCIAEGFALRAPEDPMHLSTFEMICDELGVEQGAGELLLRVGQHEQNAQLIDAEDRIRVGASLLAGMVEAEL